MAIYSILMWLLGVGFFPILLVLVLGGGMLFFFSGSLTTEGVSSIAEGHGNLTCWHCDKETQAGHRTCRQCGGELQ